jgi:murein L,D-transpeptidase YafK
VASVLEARPRTVDDVLRTVGAVRRPQLQRRFEQAGLRYPPQKVALAAYKQEREMELWASDGGPFRQVARYTIQAASGGAGPKLREGDLQVPEGVYRLTLLNPNSSYHLSMRVDYPNGFDRARARRDGRTRLGGDIYIHGRAVSIGCLAMGDEAIEELFVLAADTGLARTRVVISPNRAVGPPAADPPWVPDLYAAIKRELAALR